MAITYNVAKCRGGWGVYVRAVSGDDLRVIAPGSSLSVLRVKSGRIARKRSKLSAKNYINRLTSEPIEAQRERIMSRIWIKTAPHDYQVVKVQTLKLFREHAGHMIPTVNTINRSYAESVALHYANRGLKSFLRKTVTKYLKLPLNTDVSNLNKI